LQQSLGNVQQAEKTRQKLEELFLASNAQSRESLKFYDISAQRIKDPINWNPPFGLYEY